MNKITLTGVITELETGHSGFLPYAKIGGITEFGGDFKITVPPTTEIRGREKIVITIEKAKLTPRRKRGDHTSPRAH